MFGFISSASKNANVQEFFTPVNTIATADWIVWEKPADCKVLFGLLVGAGGGGGQGRTGVSSDLRGGGGGGGSGSISTFMLSGIFVPNQLFIKLGFKGQGLVGNGGNGNPTYVSVHRPTSDASFVLCQANGGTGGGVGGLAAAGTGGTGGTAYAPFSSTGGVHRLLATGLFNSVAGNNGGAGGNAAAGTNVSLLNKNHTILGGCGGAGAGSSTSFEGGGYNIEGYDGYPTIPGGVAQTLGLTDGNNGFLVFKDLRRSILSFGGTGGGSRVNNSGGEGGKAGPGAGGGGGGAGNGGTIGGDGGDGFAVFIWW